MFGNPLLLADDGYQISRSVRLRSSASAYFNRTPGSAGNRQTWTWSGWVKAGAISVARALFSAGADGSNYTSIDWRSDDRIQLYSNSAGIVVGSIVWDPMRFRDPSAWYHIVVTCDTTNATQTDRFRFYVNGVRFTTISGTGGENTWPTQNANTNINNTVAHSVGRKQHGANEYLDGYLTEVNFIDGQALTPSSFGETDVLTGVWKPKKYTGTYGTNGFFLNFSDNSSNTATTIGKDYSGNGNNWTPNNISVTAGSTYDSMLDVPTLWADGGNGRGNYCVANPLDKGANSVAANGNLDISSNNGTRQGIKGTLGVSTGKWYFEYTKTTAASASVGVASAETAFAADSNVGSSATSWGYLTTGSKLNNNSSSAYGATWTTNDVIGVAFDMDAGTITFYKNNSSQGQAFSGLTGTVFPMGYNGSATADIFNFGQRPFAYTPPTGFKALNTQNLPEPTIKKGNAYFDATLYTGNGTSQSIVNSGAMQPDLVWAKQRSSTQWHRLIDAVRGTNKVLYSNDTSAEFTDSTQLTAFNSNGFSVGSEAGWNANAATYVGWQWKEGATQGFDIVTYTGNGVAGRTISHSLGVTPAMTIVKDRSNGTNGWPVWHRAYAGTQTLYLESTTALLTRDRVTAVSSTTFTVGSHTEVNNNGNTYVAYLFSEVAGFSRFGSYTGNGSADGPFVFCGFRPRWVMIKRTDTTGNWAIHDTARSTFNQIGDYLLANASDAEVGGSVLAIDALSNGFKVRVTQANENASGGTYIFMAMAEHPFKLSLAR